MNKNSKIIFYNIRHIPSGSKMQISCSRDNTGIPKISSVQMIFGNIIPLSGIKEALKTFDQKHKDNNIVA